MRLIDADTFDEELRIQQYRYNNTRYCPNCGAKMDGD